MTKFAVCLYGRFGNRFDSNAGDFGLTYIRDQVVGSVDVDYFVYSYDEENQNRIIDTLGSKLRKFTFLAAPKHEEAWIEAGGNSELFTSEDSTRNLEGTLRFLAQRDGSIQLMLDHAAANGESYSGVLVCRIDLGQIDRANQRFPQRVSEAPSLESLPWPIEKVYFAAWNQLNEGLPDQWFICSMEDAEVLGGSRERVERYLLTGSSYLEEFIRSIPDSDEHDPFSNVMNSLETVTSPSSRAMSEALDNHLLHKHDFIETGLYKRLAPAIDSRHIAHLTYTHSSYLDGWYMSHKAQTQHLGYFYREYVAIESSSSHDLFPSNFSVLTYDESLSYTDRLKSVIERIPDEFLFFTHEDMPLTGTPVTNSILEALDLLRKDSQIAVVRFIRVGKGLRLRLVRPTRLPYFHKIPGYSKWQFSVQPALWRKDKLLELLSLTPSRSVWSFEVDGQRVFKSLGLKGYQPISSGSRRGRHHFESVLYPYIATAIVKGKWNSLEYPELRELIRKQSDLPFPERALLSELDK